MLEKRFVSIEGIDGSGKSTLARQLKAELLRHEIPVNQVFEPGTTALGGELRRLLKRDDPPVEPLTKALLFNAGRSSTMSFMQRIWDTDPAMIFIADRHVDSTYAYQGLEGVADRDLMELERMMARNYFVPQVTLFLDVPPEVCFERNAQRQEVLGRLGDLGKFDAYDNKPLEFYQQVYARYKQRLAADSTGRFRCLDASVDPHLVLNQALYVLNTTFNLELEIK